MTRFVDIHAVADLVRTLGPPTFLQALVESIREDFLRWPAFEKSARLASHSPVGVIELMPVSDGEHFAFKYVNGHPGNTARGLPTVMAFGVLAEVETGLPLLLAELTLTTALRTAAMSALAAQALANPGARSMALIGNGAQGEFQALAFHALLGVNELRAYDLDPAATDKLVRNLAPWPALRVHRAADIADAVRGADIVSTLTARKARATLLTPDMLTPGLHVNAVGGDCPGKTELHHDVLAAARVFVEYEPQTRIEGELQQMPPDFPAVELWRVLAGELPGREDPGQVTVFDSVGFALEDYSALRLLHRLAMEHGIGQDIALAPADGDPKDLFRLTRPPAG
ncbi:ornithine cyclodeaminase [Variovorax defluvii]|uniref:ornithine cyclodeaminase n=1 Tax=Variovorax defluvii TaxID=913761 RepID=UPI0031EF7D83